MPENTHNSFIPKSANRTIVRKRGTKLYILNYISYTFFFVVLAGVGGVYLYEYFANQELRSLQTEVAEVRDQFNSGDIVEAQYFDERLDTAWALLEASTAPSRIFTALESLVVDGVTFGKFNLSRTEEGLLQLSITGTTPTFDAAMVQRDLIAAHEAFALQPVAQFSYGLPEEQNNAPEDGLAFGAGQQEVVVTYTVAINEAEIPYTPSAPDRREQQEFDLQAQTETAPTATNTGAVVEASGETTESGEPEAQTEMQDNASSVELESVEDSGAPGNTNQ